MRRFPNSFCVTGMDIHEWLESRQAQERRLTKFQTPRERLKTATFKQLLVMTIALAAANTALAQATYEPYARLTAAPATSCVPGTLRAHQLVAGGRRRN